MSYTAPGKWKTAVRRDAPRRLKPFLLLLGDQAGRDGTVRNLTRTSIAEQFDVDTRTVQRWIKDAVSNGWVHIVQRGQKHVAAQVYGLVIPVPQGDIRSCSQGDIPMLPETPFSGRHLMSPSIDSPSSREVGAVEDDAPVNRTTAASATHPANGVKQRNDRKNNHTREANLTRPASRSRGKTPRVRVRARAPFRGSRRCQRRTHGQVVRPFVLATGCLSTACQHAEVLR